MDSNEKKSKRPRIGETRTAPESSNYQPASLTDAPTQTSEHSGERREYNYYQGPRQYNNRERQGGYYNNRYQSRDQYAPRRRYDNRENSDSEQSEQETSAENYYQQGYRQGGYRRNDQNGGGYNNNRQNGYNNNRQGGYNNNRPNGGYNNRQGGYGNRQNGYNQNRQGGYNNDNQDGYSNNRQGGYNNNRQGGGYSNNRQGGYGNRQRGGFNNNNRRPQTRHNEFGMPHGGKSFVPRPKRVEYEQTIPDPNEQIRLNKFMANAGVCSRREADEYIEKGLVKVNGETVTELGTKISHNDTVEYNGNVVTLESKCYILLNKPKDCVTTSDDPNGRLTVMDLVKNACEERIYPVGRLDRNTTGVLLLTNDGDLASKLTHPKFLKKKVYHVYLDKNVTAHDLQQIRDGITLEDGDIKADAVEYADPVDKKQVGIEIHSGKNRIVRRIFEHLGYKVTKLDRVLFAGLTKKNLRRGDWRYLTEEEVNRLRMGAYE